MFKFVSVNVRKMPFLPNIKVFLSYHKKIIFDHVFPSVCISPILIQKTIYFLPVDSIKISLSESLDQTPSSYSQIIEKWVFV